MLHLRLPVALTALALLTSALQPILADSPASVVVRGGTFTGEFDCVWEDQTGKLRYYWTAYPWLPWVQEQSVIIDNYYKYVSGPAFLVRPTGEADIAAQTPNYELRYYWAFPGTHWSLATIAGPGTTFSAPAMAVGSDGQVHIVAQGPNNSLMYYHATPGSPWATEVLDWPGTTFSAPSIAVRATGEIDVVVQGPNNSLKYYWRPQTFPVTTWFSTYVAQSGTTLSAPSIVVLSTGLAVIAAQGPDGFLLCYWASPGTPWTKETGPWPFLTFAPTVAAADSNRAEVHVVTADFNGYLREDSGSAIAWNAWSQSIIGYVGPGAEPSIVLYDVAGPDGPSQIVVSPDTTNSQLSGFQFTPNVGWYQWEIGASH